MAKKSVFDSLKGVVGKIFDDNNEKEDETRKNAVAPKLGVYGPPKVTNRATLNTRPNATAPTISGAKQSVSTPNFSPVKSPAAVPVHNAPRTHIDGTLKTSNSAFGNGAEFKPMPMPKLSSNPNPLKAGNLSSERNKKYGVDFATASNNLIDTSKFVGNKHADSTFMNTVRANNVKAMKTPNNVVHSDLNIDPTFKIGQTVKPEHGGLNIPNRENAASTTPVTFAPTKASPVKKYDVAIDKPIKESLSFEDSTLSDIDKKSLSPEAFKLIQDYEIRRKRAKHSGDIGEAAELMEQENKIRELSGYSNSDVWDIEQGNIVTASDIDKSHMGAKDLKKIESLKKDYMWQQYMYGIAKSKGDEDAINAAVNSMNSIHKEAQDLRRKYGYTGGKGGTEFRQSEKQKVAYDEKTQKDAPLVTASENLKKNPEIAYDAGSAYDDAYVMMQATDEQKKHYNYLYNTDKGKANKYFDHVIRRSVNADIAQAETEGRERANKEIDKNGSVVEKFGRTLGATVDQAVVNPIVGTANYIGNLGHYARYGEIDHNSPLNQVQKVAAAERQRFSESIDNPALRFTYDAAATALDSVAAAALGGNLGLVAMSTGAANNTLISDLEQGRDTKKAILNSFLAGAMEYFSEKLPFERLTKIMGTGFKGASKGAIKNSKDFALDIVKQMGIEGSTEVASEIGNNIANDFIYGKKSDRNLYKQQLISEGASEQEAEKKSILEYWIKNPLYAFALGAVSGGMAYGPMLTKQQLNVGKAIKKDDVTAKMLIEKGLELKDSKGKELATKLSQSSDIKPMQLANLKGYILDETYNKIKPEERQKELTEYVGLPYKDTKNRLVKAYEVGTDRDLEKFATEKYAKAYIKKAHDVLFAAESYDMMTPEERASEQGIALKSDIEEFVNNTSDLYFSDALHPQIRETTGNALAKTQDLLKSDAATMNAVGSRRGNTLTFHADYAASNNIPLVNNAVKAAQKQNVPFNVVQVQPDDHTVKLMYVPQFDTESEPRIESIATVAPDGNIRIENPKNRIITNKADYVAEDYNGFDVKAAKNRENSWKNSGIRYSVGLVNDANYFNQKFGEHLKNDTPVEETEPVETEDVSDVNTNDTVASNTEDVAENTVSDDSNIIEPESDSRVDNDSNVEDRKIAPNMSEEERYNILKDKTIEILHVEKSKNLTQAELNTLKSHNTRESKKIFMKLLSKFRVDTESTPKFKNKDVDIEFSFSNESIRESVSKQNNGYLEYTDMLINLDTLVENAIAIECHENYAVENPKGSQLKQTFILISAFNNEQGVIPVKFDARVTEDNSNKIYVAITAQKIEPDVVLATEDSKSKYDPKSKVINQLGSITVSIPSILSNINNSDVDFIKYIPDGFLSEEKLKIKNDALEHDKNHRIEKRNKSKANKSQPKKKSTKKKVAEAKEKILSEYEDILTEDDVDTLDEMFADKDYRKTLKEDKAAERHMIEQEYFADLELNEDANTGKVWAGMSKIIDSVVSESNAEQEATEKPQTKENDEGKETVRQPKKTAKKGKGTQALYEDEGNTGKSKKPKYQKSIQSWLTDAKLTADLSKNGSVADLTGNEFPKSDKPGEDLVSQVTTFFKDKNTIMRDDIGEIELSREGVRSSIAHGIGRKKAIAFKAVPNVIQYGQLISGEINYDGRGYNNHVIAAQITIAGVPHNMIVVVNDYGKFSEFYLHEVKEINNSDSVKNGATVKNGGGPVVESLLDTDTVPQSNTKSQDVLKMAAAVNDDTNTESSNIGKELNRGAFVNFDNVESNGKTEIARKAKVTGIARKLLPEEGNGSIHDLVIGIQRLFKVPVFVKGVRKNDKALGFYDNLHESISLKLDNDLTTTLHEIGHHLDKRLGINDHPAVKYMLENTPGLRDKLEHLGYEEADMLKEVVADFYRMYMTNPDAAYEYGKYGIGEGSPENFYDVLENKLVEGNIMQEVAGARRRILDYASLDIVDKVAGTIVSREPRRISWQRTRMNMYQAIVSKNAALEWLDKEIDNIARREGFAISPSQKFSLLAMAADNASGYLEKIVEPTKNGGRYIRPDGTIDYDRKTMGDILINLEKFKDAKTGKKIKYKDVVKHFDEYLKLKHAEDWAKQGKRVFPSDVMSFGDIPLATQRINDMYYRDVVDSETGETTRLTFESIANELYEWWDGFMQDWMVDTKMVDADLYEMLRTLNPHYVPNYRKLDDAVDGERNLSSSTENLMQRSSKEGSTKDTYSPTENLLMKADQIIRGVLKNNTMNLMHEFYNSDNAEIRELMGQFIKEVPTNIQVIDVDMGPVKNRLKKAIKKGKFGEDFSNTSIIDDIVSDTTTAVLPRPFKGQNVLSIKVDGKYVHYYIKQDDDFGVGVNLIKAFQTQSVQHFKTAFNIMRAFTRTWSALTTSSNPLFAISNMIRDYQHGLVFVKPTWRLAAFDVFNLQFRVEYFVTLAQCIGLHVNNAVVNKIRRKLGYADLFDGREFKKQFDLYEAQHGHAAKFMPGQDNLKKALREINDDRFIMRRGMSRAVGMIETFNNIIEQTPRMVAFKRAYKNTEGTEQDKALAAMHAAREATVNFQRRGSGISSVSAVVPFIGVAIAGIDQIGRAAKDCVKDGKPNPEGMARIGRLLATQAIPAVLLMLLLGGDDDDDNFIEKNIREGMQKFNEALGGHGIDASDKAREEYEGFNDYLKQAYWLIKVNGTWIKIPKDREISALFGSSAQLISTMILNPEYRNLDAMESYFNYAAQQFIPPHEMTGWAIVDAANNKTWYGGKILSKSDETLLTLGKDDSSKYREIRDDRTSNIAVAAAHITSRIGLMPDVLKTPKGQQYVIDQLGGGLADVLLPMTAPASTGVIDAIATRYTANPDKQSHYISEAFEIYNDLAAEKDYYNRHKSDDDEDKEKPVGSTWYDIANDTVMGNQRKMNASQSMMDLYTENKGWMHEYGKDLIDKDKFLKLTSENQAEINKIAREFVRAYKKAGSPKFDEIAETGSFAKIKMTDEMKEAGMTESLLKDIEKEMNKVSDGNKANAVAFTDGVNYETYCLYAKAQDKDITDDKLEKNFTYIQKLKSQNMTAKQYADTMDGMKKSLKRGDKSVLTGSLAAELYYLTNPNLTEEQQLTMFEMYNSAENVDAKLKYARIAIANGVTADKLQDLNVALPKDPTKEQIINTALSMGWTKSQVYSYYNFKTKRK